MTDVKHDQRSVLLQDQFGRRIAARLSAQADFPHDISERLRVARQQAVASRKLQPLPQRQLAPASGLVLNGNTASVRDEGLNPWRGLAAALPLVALVVGLVAINVMQNDNRAREVAEVDAALLTDPLPPAAYTDPGFLQFLKSAASHSHPD